MLKLEEASNNVYDSGGLAIDDGVLVPYQVFSE
jgi:hypothetical protein